jgi:hypothetical protein
LRIGRGIDNEPGCVAFLAAQGIHYSPP